MRKLRKSSLKFPLSITIPLLWFETSNIPGAWKVTNFYNVLFFLLWFSLPGSIRYDAGLVPILKGLWEVYFYLYHIDIELSRVGSGVVLIEERGWDDNGLWFNIPQAKEGIWRPPYPFPLVTDGDTEVPSLCDVSGFQQWVSGRVKSRVPGASDPSWVLFLLWWGSLPSPLPGWRWVTS